MNFQLKNSKLLTLPEALEKRKVLQEKSKTCVLTNGCFDLLHPGHVYALQAAARLGDELYVALNSKQSVALLKGPARPLYNDTERAYMLASLECVKGIFVFHNARLIDEILAFKPDVYVKSGDYTLETLDAAERKALESVGAAIHFIPFLPGYSTTKLIQKIRAD